MNRSTAKRVRQCVLAIGLWGGVSAYGQQELERLSVPIPLPDCTIKRTDAGQGVALEGFGVLHEPGVPQLPVRIFPIALPPGAELVDVSWSAREPIDPENPQLRAAELRRFAANRSAIYGSDEPYPAEPISLERRARYRGCNLVDVRVVPLAYRPASGRLLRYMDLTVHVGYRLPARPVRAVAERWPTIQRTARELILNCEQAVGWYAPPPMRGNDHY